MGEIRLLEEINNYFRYQKCFMESFEKFKHTGLYEFYGNIFGPLVFTEERTHNFIGLDQEGNMYDEIYYPQKFAIKRKGTIIPLMFLESETPIYDPDPIWKSVASKGYAKIETMNIPRELAEEALNESFIPHGLNENLNMSKSIFHAYYATLADYKNPEDHKDTEYLHKITQVCIPQIPRPPSIVENYILHTADIVKYVYDPSDLDSTKGPYSFHMDYFPRLFFMFFTYFSKNIPIDGRELLVGKREDFTSFSREALDMSPAQQPIEENPFESVSDDRISEFESIKIDHNTVILMNTLNPMFVHKVEKLRSKNEVVLLTHYLWSGKWNPVD